MTSSTNFALRRLLFAALVGATTVGLSVWLTVILAEHEFTVLGAILVLTFAVKVLWVSLVFWSSAIGFGLRHATTDPVAAVLPPIARVSGHDPITVKTAIVMPVRDEDAKHVFDRLEVVKASIDATGAGNKFDYFLLSDSTTAAAVAAEEQELASLRARPSGTGVIYRRREINVDFKGGNLRDFCARWGQNYELMVVLDADSVMTGQTILRLVRIMQVAPQLGILQSVIDCVQPPTAMARIFEFGHRLVWRNYILGSAWWQQERGQYRGHNAAIRVDAYAAHARLSDRDGVRDPSSHVMCSDQVESALLHRAGYEVRELPAGGGSYEGLPPALPDFLDRYQRWCQGNLKNLRLLWLPGLSLMDRYHFAGVAHRFLGWPAFVIFVVLAAYSAAAWPPEAQFAARSAAALYAAFLILYFAPRIFGLIDAALAGASRYGGMPRLAIGGAIDFVFTLLLVPVAMVGVTWFMAQLLFGRRPTWAPQRRTQYRLSWTRAARALWPQTAVGSILAIALAVAGPAALPWFLPFVTGLVLAIPFGVVTSSRRFSAWMDRRSLCAMPEEITPPSELAELRRRIRKGVGS
jgi:membrane glycosyltransferase